MNKISFEITLNDIRHDEQSMIRDALEEKRSREEEKLEMGEAFLMDGETVEDVKEKLRTLSSVINKMDMVQAQM